MNERNLLRGGAPIVSLAHRAAFQQEADTLLALSADHSGAPVPHITIRISPDPAAGETRPAAPAAPAEERGGKHD